MLGIRTGVRDIDGRSYTANRDAGGVSRCPERRSVRMKRLLAGVFAGVTALTLTVGCAKQLQQLEPKLEIKKAAEALGATGTSGFTLKAGGSVDDVIALAKKDSGTGEDAFTDEDADMLR